MKFPQYLRSLRESTQQSDGKRLASLLQVTSGTHPGKLLAGLGENADVSAERFLLASSVLGIIDHLTLLRWTVRYIQ